MFARLLPRIDSSSTELLERDTLEDIDEFEDTQPSVLLPDADDDFGDAPTLPGFGVRARGSFQFGGSIATAGDDGQWDRALRAVAVAVKRVFASHAIG